MLDTLALPLSADFIRYASAPSDNTKLSSLTDRNSDLEDAIGRTVENTYQSVSKDALCDTPNDALIQSGKWESRSPSQVMRKLTSQNSPLIKDLDSLSMETITIRSIE